MKKYFSTGNIGKFKMLNGTNKRYYNVNKHIPKVTQMIFITAIYRFNYHNVLIFLLQFSNNFYTYIHI